MGIDLFALSTVSKSRGATRRLSPPYITSVYDELCQVATPLTPEIYNMY